ncbi:hypothetical protein PR202_ga18678 [Eleusine coracana subsp. coracana]|uniref:Uncharacterized protein n=1 Tax=Eleusine coracana subsp. coracana TaxID=191504 RepID=A0AAV5CSF8_ELECO|nr:hypothetical protein PR202_ga18678 [Eleusine coracana subsp. coracana]
MVTAGGGKPVCVAEGLSKGREKDVFCMEGGPTGKPFTNQQQPGPGKTTRQDSSSEVVFPFIITVVPLCACPDQSQVGGSTSSRETLDRIRFLASTRDAPAGGRPGKVFVHGASEATGLAYKRQFQSDLARFLRCRAAELNRPVVFLVLPRLPRPAPPPPIRAP